MRNAVCCPLKFSSVPITESMKNSLIVARRTVELRDDNLVSVSASLDREETERPSLTATATNTSAEPYRSSNARESNDHASARTKDESSKILLLLTRHMKAKAK